MLLIIGHIGREPNHVIEILVDNSIQYIRGFIHPQNTFPNSIPFWSINRFSKYET